MEGPLNISLCLDSHTGAYPGKHLKQAVQYLIHLAIYSETRPKGNWTGQILKPKSILAIDSFAFGKTEK